MLTHELLSKAHDHCHSHFGPISYLETPTGNAVHPERTLEAPNRFQKRYWAQVQPRAIRQYHLNRKFGGLFITLACCQSKRSCPLGLPNLGYHLRRVAYYGGILMLGCCIHWEAIDAGGDWSCTSFIANTNASLCSRSSTRSGDPGSQRHQKLLWHILFVRNERLWCCRTLIWRWGKRTGYIQSRTYQVRHDVRIPDENEGLHFAVQEIKLIASASDALGWA